MKKSEQRFKSCGWESELSAGPRVIRVTEIQRRYHQSGTRCVNNDFWSLDFSFTDTGFTRIGSKKNNWLRRAKNMAHLYPPRTTYWEKYSPLIKKAHSAYVCFADGDSANLQSLLDPVTKAARFHDPNNLVGTLLLKCLALGSSRRSDSFWKAQAFFSEIIGLLKYSKPMTDSSRIVDNTIMYTPQDSFIANVKDFINRNSSRKITLNEIAKSVKVSVSTLTHRYQENTGISPIHEHALLRIERAKELLDLDEPHKNIAELLEFSDVYHFSKNFKMLTGLSPSEYKKR